MAEFAGVHIESLDQILAREEQDQLDSEDGLDIEKEDEGFKSALASFIHSNFSINRDAKRDSGIEEEILASLRAYNGEYADRDKLRIQQDEQGSNIFMNITATQSRACKSWMADIFQPANDFAWLLENSPNPDLPTDITQLIESSIQREFAEAFKGTPNKQTTQEAQESIKETNKLKRDIKDAISEEINNEAMFQTKVMERQIRDQLAEGKWDATFLEFLEDFSVYPTAFVKGPIISSKKQLKWVNGKAKVVKELVSLNERVDPLDMYPSPSSKGINDGNLIEHVRFQKKSIMDLKGVPGYSDEKIDEVLLSNINTPGWLSQDWTETERADQERRGNQTDANEGLIHGLHWHGPIEVGLIREWQPSSDLLSELSEFEDGDLVEAECILVNNDVIKCALNSDPLDRRPYYKASFVNRPGGFWGRSLPDLIRDIQRMCNAVARALANNLAIASGPQVEVNIDRLADNGDIEAMKPFGIWQTKSDASGGNSKAIDFFQPQSNAGELLKVYQEFEIRAGETIGIPRLAQGNDRTAGLAATVGGLTMLLENASKVIKDAIRNIDEGVVKPRVEQEFYIHMLKNSPVGFSGDVTVVPRGSSALTIKSAEKLRRNEFLQITANPIDQGIMGTDRRAAILKVIGKELGLPDVVPGPLELKKKEQEAQAQIKQQQEQLAAKEQADREASLGATKLQIDGQKEMHSSTMQLKIQELQAKIKDLEESKQIEVAKLQQDGMKAAQAHDTAIQVATLKDTGDTSRQVREVALTLSGEKKDDGI